MNRSLILPCVLPLLFGGCWYRNFSVDPSLDPRGGAGGEAGSAGTGGASGGEGGVVIGALTAVLDEIVLDQGESLAAGALDVLANDTGEALRVVGFDDADPARPSSIDADEVAIEESGNVRFTPSPDFFGTYRMTYEVEDASGQRASADVRIVVRPRNVRLSLIAAGYGGFVVDGAAGDALGQRVARAFDVNGDGVEDFLVGAEDGGAGYAVVIYGKEGIESFSLGDASLAGKAALLVGPSLGGADRAVAFAGDLNGDGRGDVLVGAPLSATGDGAAYVVFGATNLGTSVDLSTLGAGEGYRLDGFSTAQTGKLVAGGRDVDGDGVDDVVVVSRHGSAADNAGSVSVVAGPGSGGALTAQRGLFINGIGSGQRLDVDLSLLGDLDGDGRSEVAIVGFDDLLVLRGVASPGAWPVDPSTISAGATSAGWRESFGSPDPQRRVSGVGDFNGDQIPDLVLCDGESSCAFRVGRANLNLSTGFGLTGLASSPRVDGGADANGDGLGDFALVDSGRAYLVLGREVLPTEDIDLSSPTENEILIEAEPGAALSEVALIGDVNGDGRSDLAVTAPTHGAGAGRVYVVFGP